jgi:hypothetical protein
MYYGTIILVNILVTSIIYWKCNSKDPKDLLSLLNDKQKGEHNKTLSNNIL